VKTKPAALLVLLVILGLLLPLEAHAEFTDLPVGFDDQPVAHGLSRPTALDWLPDSETDRLLVATQGGTVFQVAANGAATNILNLVSTVCSGGETGLLGLAVDPDFSALEQRFIYLYYTDKRGSGDCGAASRANRVSRFTMDDQGHLGGEIVLIDNIPAPGGNHNGGDLQFGSDGLLYISVGDGGQDLKTGAGQNGNGNARRLDVLVGKILRIETDGGIPTGNPFQGPGTGRCAATGGAQSQVQDVTAGDKAEKKRNEKKKKRKSNKKKHKASKKKDRKQKRRQQRRKNRQDKGSDQGSITGSGIICREIFATGLRNPFRIAFDENNPGPEQRLFINDVGGGAWEEIDLAAPGADYGWNVREGPCPTGVSNIASCSPSGQFVEPVFAYNHANGCRTITGGAFVPDEADWSDYDGMYFYADFICGRIFALGDESPGESPDVFAAGTGATHLAIGPDGDLYYATFDAIDGIPGSAGQVRKIVPPA
jgi:glucose/arabinose dehydrogenase